MGIAKGVEACRLDLRYPGPDLFAGKGMAVADAMFVFRDAVDEDRFAVEQEGMRAGLMWIGPVDRADTIGRRHPIDDPAITRNTRHECIEIGRFRAPEMRLPDGGKLLAYGNRLIRFDGLSLPDRGNDCASNVEQLLGDDTLHRCRAVIF